jgi:hypothetical protein
VDERYCKYFKKKLGFQLPPRSVEKTRDRGGRYPFDEHRLGELLWQNTY